MLDSLKVLREQAREDHTMDPITADDIYTGSKLLKKDTALGSDFLEPVLIKNMDPKHVIFDKMSHFGPVRTCPGR